MIERRIEQTIEKHRHQDGLSSSANPCEDGTPSVMLAYHPHVAEITTNEDYHIDFQELISQHNKGVYWLGRSARSRLCNGRVLAF